MRDVAAFAQEKGLVEHIPLLRNGALVAQDPSKADNIDGDEALNEVEKRVLREEITHRWRMPWRLFLTIATCSVRACFPKEYGLDCHDARSRLVSRNLISM
jgi:hypothetical protein